MVVTDAAGLVSAAPAALVAVTTTVVVLTPEQVAGAVPEARSTAALVVVAGAAVVDAAAPVSRAAKFVLKPRAPLKESAAAPVFPSASAVFWALRQRVTWLSVCLRPQLLTRLSQVCKRGD